MHASFNVVIFGEAGVGKSSVINLIAGRKVAETSPNSWGCTLESKQCTFEVAGRTFNVWDTIGLGEPTFSDTNYIDAIEKTYSLIQRITAEGGLDLLLFCLPGSGARISKTTLSNYRLFFEVLCEKRVPIALVVTHLERETRLDDWWDRNVGHLKCCDLRFSGHACVTGLPGHEMARESRVALEHLLLGYDLDGRYIMPSASEWNLGFLTRLASRPSLIPRQKEVKDKRKQLERLLRDRCMMNDDDARKLADALFPHAYSPSLSTQDRPIAMRSFNVILFGEVGVGKSSVINLISGKDVANTSRDARGRTLKPKQYTFEVAERTFNIWNAIGLGEPSFSVSSCLGVIEQACALIKQIEAQGGLDLLLFCMPGCRVTATMQHNYRLFFEVLCKEQIPIAAVVTRLEDEEKMEEWWYRNEEYLSKWGLKFGGHACVTGQRGHAKAAEGRSALELLLLGHDHEGRYPMPPTSDWCSGSESPPRIPPAKELKHKRSLERSLRKRCKLANADAQRLAEILCGPGEQN